MSSVLKINVDDYMNASARNESDAIDSRTWNTPQRINFERKSIKIKDEHVVLMSIYEIIWYVWNNKG